MSNGLERQGNASLEGMPYSFEATRDLAPTYREEEMIIKKRVIGQRFLDEQSQIVQKGVSVLSDTYYDCKVAHRVAGDRTYRLLSDVEDEVQFKGDAEFYGGMDQDLDGVLSQICRVTGNAVVTTLQSHQLPKDALLIRQEEEARAPETVAEKRKLTPGERLSGSAWITYTR